MRLRCGFLAAMLISLIVGGLSAQGQVLASEQVLRYACESGEIGDMDPHFTKSSDERPLVHAIFNALLRFQPGSLDIDGIEGDLAESWERSSDGLVWTFNLRRGVQWHRGYGEFTAEDVKFSFERVINPDVGSPWRGTYENVVRIDVVDPYTVKMYLAKPDPYFVLKLISDEGGYIVSKAAVTALGDGYGLNPIGTGPFMFEEYKPQEKVVLVRNDRYFRGTPIITRIDYLFMADNSTRLLALQTGEIDAAGFPADEGWVEAVNSVGCWIDYKHPGNQFQLHFNMTREPLDNLLVRQALAYAIDRSAFADYRGKSLTVMQASPVPSGYDGYTTAGLRSYDYNPDLAKALLAQAGYPNGFSLGEVPISSKGGYQPYMVIIQEQWRKIGVDMELAVMEHTAFHAIIREDASPVVFFNGSRVPIADSFLSEFYHSAAIVGTPTAVTNFSHYGEAIPGVDYLIDRARNEMDRELQLELYAAAQRIIMADLPVYPLFMGISIRARQPYVVMPYIVDHKYYNLWGAYIFDETTYLLQH